MRIIFRADGNAQIGLGHVVRSLALAAVVEAVGPCYFAVQQPTAAVRNLLAQAGVTLIELPEQPWLAEAHYLSSSVLQASDIVVLDGYHFDRAYQEIIKNAGCRLVCIDDLHATSFVADLIINHSPGVTPCNYSALPGTRYCLGPGFSLLRPAFLRHALAPTAAPVPISNVLLCFGGADPQQVTTRMLTALLALPAIQQIGVVLGGAFNEQAALTEILAQHTTGRIEVHRNIPAEALVTLLLRYQVVVCPASTVLIESLILGRAALTGYYVENQRHLADYVHAHQQAFSLGDLTQLPNAALPATLQQGLHFHEATLRAPYALELAHSQLQAEFRRLAGQ
ncbi:UDP-2,4-diacetamido-2,4,6-trideoxy-beta-L-altropyranose hydrolase [Hymenobacter sp. BT186]|uniref:UDP-2,4-diacetamido-2,4, 6-trideoxy-beta-L-altropyranose hydrolase n=1 Tax=Hymenobacter telluris TaxID=2816474 RepID=A0A939J7D5_9BACT|nr:UDP-2,4-diacetamido-2,4,6-trideoxy-beta-L-altropyranose hydrolase [Hymenobacter telluris]MBO0356619.1 UDP-2,4-diacetamido-2,4,6-trideoxy-beta-L-altropyranose hydrolase [Hymenobacter telluris]MBW3372644.1 UDP-2,4-diacetamido-2,4,6-trideoxy-beta-L-altropyranose hydrolase [Hymenobacter norwichensis]